MQKKKPLRTSLTLAGLSLPALAAAQEFEAFRDIMPSGDGGIWIRAGEELSYVPAGQYILQTDGSALVSTSVLDFLNEVETASAGGFWGPTTKTIMLSGGSAVALGGAALFAPALWTPQSASAVEVDASVSGTVGLDASTISLDAASPVPVTGTVGLNASPLTGTVGLSASPLTGTVGLNASPLTGTVGLNASPLTGSVSLNASALTGSVTGTVALSSSTIATSGPPVFDDLRSVLTTKTFTGEVFAAIANDPDGGTVSYELLPILNHSDYTVDGSGLITKTGTTTDPVQYIAVKATDDEADTAQAIYKVEFVDETSSSNPIISPTVTSFEITENAGIGTIVGDLDAKNGQGSNEDEGLFYSILETSYSHPFSIDAAGNIYVSGAIDYEAKSSYSITVKIENSVGNADYQSINIQVTDQTDDLFHLETNYTRVSPSGMGSIVFQNDNPFGNTYFMMEYQDQGGFSFKEIADIGDKSISHKYGDDKISVFEIESATEPSQLYDETNNIWFTNPNLHSRIVSVQEFGEKHLIISTEDGLSYPIILFDSNSSTFELITTFSGSNWSPNTKSFSNNVNGSVYALDRSGSTALNFYEIKVETGVEYTLLENQYRTGITSGILADSNHLYFTANERLVSLDLNTLQFDEKYNGFIGLEDSFYLPNNDANISIVNNNHNTGPYKNIQLIYFDESQSEIYTERLGGNQSPSGLVNSNDRIYYDADEYVVEFNYNDWSFEYFDSGFGANSDASFGIVDGEIVFFNTIGDLFYIT